MAEAKAHMQLKDNAHNHMVTDKWGWVDMVDCYGRKYERIAHWEGNQQRKKLEKIVREFNQFTGYGDYTG